MLVVRLAGAEAAVRGGRRTAGRRAHRAAGTPDRFWNDLRDQRDEFFVAAGEAVRGGATLWRLSVAPAAPPLADRGRAADRMGRRAALGRQTRPMQRRCARWRASHGGHATAFRGSKRDGAFTPLAPPLLRIHRELKARFDPDRMFNPGRLYP